MIEVRCRLSDRGGIYWTGPLRNPRAVACLVAEFRRRGYRVEVFDDPGHANIAELCFEIAGQRPELAACGELAFGPAGNACYCVAVAQLPSAGQDTLPALPSGAAPNVRRRRRTYAPVRGGFPLLDEPAPPAVAPRPIRPVFEPDDPPPSWLDRLLAWVFGGPRGGGLEA